MSRELDDALTFVRSTVAGFQAVDPERIQLSTRLREDLGIDGDDWDELVEQICASHPVDWSGFRFSDFFYPEPSLLTIPLMLFRPRRRSLSIEHLAQVVKAGRWLEIV